MAGQNNEIYLEAKVLNVWNMVLLVALGAGAIFSITVMIRRIGKNRGEE